MTDELTNENAHNKLIELLAEARIAMLTTMDESGQHIGRPMTLQEVESDGSLWFFASRDSRKVRHIQDEPQVGITIDNGKNTWVSMTGTAYVVEDKTKILELWNPLLKAWFPDGPESPELILIQFQADGAEYWDAPDSKVATLISLVKGAVTGKPADPGDNEKIAL